MTRRKHSNPITNQTFSLLDGSRARVRVCRHYDRVMMIGVAYPRPVSGGLGWERMLLPEGRRWKQLMLIATGVDDLCIPDMVSPENEHF